MEQQFEALVEGQNIVADKIFKILVNFKKDGAERKSAEYLEHRSNLLVKLWADFKDRHNKLACDLVADHPYFLNKTFEETQERYETTLQTLTSKLAEIKANSGPDPSFLINIPSTSGKSPSLSAPASSISTQQSPGTSASGKAPKLSAPLPTVRKHICSPTAATDCIPLLVARIPLSKMPQTSESHEWPDEIKRLLRRQKIRRTNVERKIESITSPSNESLSYNKFTLESISEVWKRFVDGQEDLIAELGEDDDLVHSTMEDYHALSESYEEAVNIIQSHLDEKDNRTRNRTDTSVRPASIQLAAVSIPKFYGDYIKWPAFKDLFTSMVDQNPSLSNVMKLQYLKTVIGGEAEQLLRQIDITDANYQTAFQLLLNRYENTRVIVNSHIARFHKMQQIKSESAIAIKALLDTTTETIRSLSNIGRPTEHWDDLIVFTVVQKLDLESHKQWEQSIGGSMEPPTWTMLQDFLTKRFRSLEAINTKTRYTENKSCDYKNSSKPTALLSSSNSKSCCKLCSKEHNSIRHCQAFLKLKPSDRMKHATKIGLCINCLRSSHKSSACTSGCCRKCNKHHNTLLHIDAPQQPQQQQTQPHQNSNVKNGNDSQIINNTNLAAIGMAVNTKYVLLATAIVNIRDKYGNLLPCRAILDSGSQLSFITESMVQKLGLQHSKKSLNIGGIGSTQSKSDKRVNLLISSRVTGYSTELEAFILNKITSDQPSISINADDWQIPRNISLADPNFNQPAKIDLLIGAELYSNLMSIGQIKLNNDLPVLQNSLLGWIVLGKILNVNTDQPFCGIGTVDDIISNEVLDKMMNKFWEIEENIEATLKRKCSPMEKLCEDHFINTTIRSSAGRFIVSLPYISDPSELGLSKERALLRFLSLERKFAREPQFKADYIQFMEEYRQLNHMEEVKPTDLTGSHFFLPHHGVLRPESTTTKLRVVFDASAKTSTNLSLNDILATGPTIQDDLFSILVRFRTYQFVFSADIAKMYRQVKMNRKDRNMQIIMWISDQNEPIKYFRLRTVTYGTRPAAYLATRCLKALADEGSQLYPLASRATSKDSYVDDLMTGTNDLGEAKQLQQDLIKIMSSGGFVLRKWCSNNESLLENILPEHRQHELRIKEDPEDQIKTLGITWLPLSDQLSIKTNWVEPKRLTKRTILADISRLFDPLGLVNPVIVTAKIFMQELWKLNLDWDAAIPVELHTKWLQFRESLKLLDCLKIPRCLIIPDSNMIEIHAFSDASEKAYGSAVYLKSRDNSGNYLVRLICAKSRVAPVKQTTLPRLELNAAKLTADLVQKLKSDMNLNVSRYVYWTDSEIVLSWLNSTSSSQKTYVANRISAIQDITSADQWRHVPTKLNPADMVSRGLAPEKLIHSSLWFSGPEFLRQKETEWPINSFNKITIANEERQSKTVLTTVNHEEEFISRIKNRNSFQYLQDVVAYILRFTTYTRNRESRKETSVLQPAELNDALLIILKYMQSKGFHEDILQMKRNGTVAKSSNLASLNPFIDDQGVIRVGGRLEAANIPYDAKHPYLLPNSHEFTILLMTQIHLKNLHAGPQALIALTRQKFWPIHAKQLARNIVNKCVLCSRAKPRLASQLMGNLPSTRVQPARPFINVGIDFCGPIYIHYRIRGKQPTKSYICVFVCFTTRAIHLELVSDLSTPSFIGSLKRFIGRRGRPATINCDNATNFVGASNELSEVRELFKSEAHQTTVQKTCSESGIEWKFIPPRSPHFGGLWEAAVKSTKHHLRRILHNVSLTFEELTTTLAEIEAILNSRPITPISNDPNELEALTPGHFLIGEALTTMVDTQARKREDTLAKRWNVIKTLKQEFWKRWTLEYLNQLQQRHKWKSQTKNLLPGTLVVLKDDNLPPLKWLLGRVVNPIEGSDGKVRVVEVRTANGIRTTAIHRIAPLPVEITNEHDDIGLTIISPVEVPNQENDTASSNGSQSRKRSSKNIMEEQQPTAKRTISSTNARSTASSLIFILTAMLLVAMAVGVPKINNQSQIPAHRHYKITNQQISSGIYFEEFGRINLLTDEWDLLIYYDMSNYWLEITQLEGYVKKLNGICSSKKLEKEPYCSAIVNQLEHQLAVIRSKNKLLESHNFHQKRSRRSPLNIVGNAANYLFGILDDNFANMYEQQIIEVKTNENFLLQLAKNHTSILEVTANIIKKDKEDVLLQFDEFREELRTLSNSIEHMKIFSALSIHTMLILVNYLRTQDTLIDVITNIQNGKIISSMLTPEQLQAQLNTIQQNVPAHLSIPRTNDLQGLYQLITLKSRMTSRNLLISIKIPLITNEEFQLFKIIPVPVQHEDKFINIKTSTDYLLANLQRNLYYPLTHQELLNCHSIQEGRYTCFQKHPLYLPTSNTSRCEFDLLRNQQHLPEKCIVYESPLTNTWIQLHNPTNWFFVLPQREPVDIICGEEISSDVLHGMGILQVNPGCVVKHSSMIIKSQNVYHGELRTSFVPSINLTSEITTGVIIHRYANISQLHHNETTQLIRMLHDQKNIENSLPISIDHHDIHHYAMSYFLLVTIIVIAVFYWVKLRRTSLPVERNASYAGEYVHTAV